jgi:hypothetical protein
MAQFDSAILKGIKQALHSCGVEGISIFWEGGWMNTTPVHTTQNPDITLYSSAARVLFYLLYVKKARSTKPDFYT